MSVYNAAFVNSELLKLTSIFGLRLWVVIGILIGSLIVITLFLLSICITFLHPVKNTATKTWVSLAFNILTPVISEEIQEIMHHPKEIEIQLEIGKPDHRVNVDFGVSHHGLN